ncbi:hypothetical protein NLG42_02765 [Flavobacterium plurextorum]|uniref:hypothetical protein n=1 Tax=Flavobacterium TaxID=237 RepID=UPI00214D6DCE|nr:MULTISPECIES: hypothetical protein [Flavobacterium]UUW09728.1 hypothetical protein NLG42_02765 [Flavobacterium plurextorum]
MKNFFLALFLISAKVSFSQTAGQKFVSTDIDNFWKAKRSKIKTVFDRISNG